LGSGRTERYGAGPKAALLDDAAQAGIAVPRGVVVLDGASPSQVAPVLGEIGTVTFAVRSAFAAEDGATASLAGWFESKLRVPAGEVPGAIDEVRASAGRRPGTFRLDVLVMAMVAARHAGVAFSEPGTYDDVVNVTTGTAERLVAGDEPGERMLVARLEPAERGWQRRLQRLLRAVRRVFGDEPWDVEWADDGSTCWLVQLRRVTRPSRRDEAFTIANHAEILPPLPSTLMTSVVAGAGPQLFDWYRRAVPSLPANRPFLEVIAGRPFINLSLLEDMLRDLGLPTRLVADSIGGPPVVDRPLRPLRVLRSSPSLLRLGLAQVTAVRRARRIEASIVAIGRRPMPTFAAALDALHDAYVALVTGMFPLSSAIGPPLAALRRAGTLHDHASRHRTVTVELADAVAGVRNGTVPIEVFLERFGHRGVYESDIARPRYHDDPSALRTTDDRVAPAAVRATGPTGRRSVRVVVTAPLWWLARPPLAARERLRNEAMRGFAGIRAALVELARAAVADGRLPSVEALWLLDTDEARSLDRGRVFDAADSDERAAARTGLAVLDPPPVIRRSDDPASWAPGGRDDRAASTWRGLSLTTGVVRGRAWVLDEPAHALPEGFDAASTVLVARSIDAGWVTTLDLVAAAVVETGGDLSHGSILVRELGLPAVTNVRGIRRSVVDGDELEVRAAAGVVERIVVRSC
jgi:pyruvate,water dikinase